MKTVVYLQFTNPGAYPPLIHSSDILLEEGWQVLFLGVQSRGLSRNIAMAERKGREVRMLKWVDPGIQQKLHYVRYVLWGLWFCIRLRTDLVYCSDPFSALPGILLRTLGFRVIYHEHDSPNPNEDDKLPDLIVWGRRKLLRQASLVIFPNVIRLERARQWSGSKAFAIVVWNCPGKAELGLGTKKSVTKRRMNSLRLYYHGTLVPDRLPLTILDAISRCISDVELTLVGYTTVGADNYDEILQEYADRLGIKDRFNMLGALTTRDHIMTECGKHDAGLVLFTGENCSVYASEMAGASNKPFDYLSQGLAVMVSDNPEWQHLYVDNDCAVVVDVEDPEALANVFDWFSSHPEKIREMGQKGRLMIEQQWNYERQFQPVLHWINNG